MEDIEIEFQQLKDREFDIQLTVKCYVPVADNKIRYEAPNPPDYRGSFSGSALPFYSKEQAFEGTINKGNVSLKQVEMINERNEVYNYFYKGVIFIKFPNSYYTNVGNLLVLPHILLKYKTLQGVQKTFVYKLTGQSIPYRTLTHPSMRTSPLFYKPKMNIGVMSQEDLLRRSEYPRTNKPIASFW